MANVFDDTTTAPSIEKFMEQFAIDVGNTTGLSIAITAGNALVDSAIAVLPAVHLALNDDADNYIALDLLTGVIVNDGASVGVGHVGIYIVTTLAGAIVNVTDLRLIYYPAASARTINTALGDQAELTGDVTPYREGNWATADAAFTGSVTGDVLNITAVASGIIAVGSYVIGGASLLRQITGLLTGTGGAGTYQLAAGDDSASGALTSTTSKIVATIGQYAMRWRTHNVACDATGAHAGRDAAGTCAMQVWLENDVIRYYTAVTGAAGSLPVWTEVSYLDLQTGDMPFLQSGVGAVATTVQAKLRESVSVEDFGAIGDGVTDDAAAIQAAIAYAVSACALLKFTKTAVYAVASQISLASLNNITIDFNAAVLKATAAMVSVLLIDQCSHITLIKPNIDGNALATDGIHLNSSAGTSCAFNNIHEPVVYNCLNSNLRFGDYSDSANDYAIDRNNIYNPRLYQALYNIFSDSLNAMNNNIYGGSCAKLNTSAANSPKHDVYIKRGSSYIYALYTVGAMRDAYDSWVYRIDDGEVNVFGGYSEAGFGLPNAGQIFMGARVEADAGQKANFYGWRCYSRGCATDPVVTDGTLVYIADGANDLQLSGCIVHKYAFAGVNVVPIRVHANANFTSSGTNYINSPNIPWRGPANIDSMGRITTSGDRSTTDLATWYDIPEFSFESNAYVDNASHNVTGTADETTMSTVTLPEYYLSDRGGLRIKVAGIISGGGVGTKTIKFYFGTTSVTMYAAASQYDWHLEVLVFNTGFATQRICLILHHSGGAVLTAYATSTQNTANPVTIKMTGQLTVGTENIGQRMFLVERV